MKNIDQAFDIIENSIEEAEFSGPIDLEKIQEAEKKLGIEFSVSYNQFLERYGAGDIFGIEIYGIIKDPITDKPVVPNGIWLTQKLREEISLPYELFIIAETGYGPYYVLDTSQKNSAGEMPVYVWDVGNQKEKESDSFGDFFLSLLEEAALD